MYLKAATFSSLQIPFPPSVKNGIFYIFSFHFLVSLSEVTPVFLVMHFIADFTTKQNSYILLVYEDASCESSSPYPARSKTNDLFYLMHFLFSISYIRLTTRYQHMHTLPPYSNKWSLRCIVKMYSTDT